jgi:hypothetical protein
VYTRNHREAKKLIPVLVVTTIGRRWSMMEGDNGKEAVCLRAEMAVTVKRTTHY